MLFIYIVFFNVFKQLLITYYQFGSIYFIKLIKSQNLSKNCRKHVTVAYDYVYM